MPFFAWICALILAAAAAAAAAALFLVPAFDGLSVASRVTGLRSRSDSDSLREGDLERRSVSKRERAGRSGSSLSKRDRGRRSSDMVARKNWCYRESDSGLVKSAGSSLLASACRGSLPRRHTTQSPIGRGRRVNQKFWALWGSSHTHQRQTLSFTLANRRRRSITLIQVN
jgi:hypothetical protein